MELFKKRAERRHGLQTPASRLLTLMLTVAGLRHTVAVTLAFHSGWAADAGFAAATSAAYGVPSDLPGRALFILGRARPSVLGPASAMAS